MTMTQNIYDDPLFFATYSRLGRSVDGLAGAPERPSMRALLPDMHGSRIVDLGCGFAWFCRWAREHGAARVLGLDISEKMPARARAMTSDERERPKFLLLRARCQAPSDR
jgi:SAM-dependent methyltransferase